jgi:hypothetical protein
MPRRKGHGGQSSRESPERETKANQTESEPEGSMGDNPEGTMLQILKDLVKGQNEASQRQAETTRFQQQTLEVLTQLVGQRGNTNGTGQGGPSGSHWGDMIHTKSRNNHTPTQSGA